MEIKHIYYLRVRIGGGGSDITCRYKKLKQGNNIWINTLMRYERQEQENL